jgi:hypothetical protein
VHVIIVNFGPNGTTWPFYFSDPARAQQSSDELARALGGPVLDDYGQSATRPGRARCTAC